MRAAALGASRPDVLSEQEADTLALVGFENTSYHRLMDRVASGGVLLAIGADFLRELSRVVSRPSGRRPGRCGLDIGVMGLMHRPSRYDWPSVMDRKDRWTLDLAWFSRADGIVNRDPGPTSATVPFSVEVLEPEQLLSRLLS